MAQGNRLACIESRYQSESAEILVLLVWGAGLCGGGMNGEREQWGGRERTRGDENNCAWFGIHHISPGMASRRRVARRGCWPQATRGWGHHPLCWPQRQLQGQPGRLGRPTAQEGHALSLLPLATLLHLERRVWGAAPQPHCWHRQDGRARTPAGHLQQQAPEAALPAHGAAQLLRLCPGRPNRCPAGARPQLQPQPLGGGWWSAPP